jgi:hypothetical protein
MPSKEDLWPGINKWYAHNYENSDLKAHATGTKQELFEKRIALLMLYLEKGEPTPMKRLVGEERLDAMLGIAEMENME